MGHASARSGDDTYQHLRVFQDVVSLVLNNYVEEVKVDRAMEGAMKGLADGLDPDSAYLTAKQVADLDAGAAQPGGDIGLEMTRQYYLRVISARDGSPAAKAGLQTGDYVRAIDGKPTRDMSVFEGSRLLRGEPGSKVVLTIIRGNAADPHEVSLVREKAPATFVSGRLIAITSTAAAPGGTSGDAPLLTPEAGYVRVTSFGNGIADELSKKVAELSKAGAKALVVDVRGTAEGPLENGIAAARLFVKSGTLSIRAGRDGQNKETFEAKAGDGAITLPVQVLVTTGTSGAAEAVCRRAPRQQARRSRRRTNARSRRPAAAGQAAGRPRPLAHLRAVTTDRRRPEPVRRNSRSRRPRRRPRSEPVRRRPNASKVPGAEPINGKGLQPDVNVEEPDVAEFGSKPTATTIRSSTRRWIGSERRRRSRNAAGGD